MLHKFAECLRDNSTARKHLISGRRPTVESITQHMNVGVSIFAKGGEG